MLRGSFPHFSRNPCGRFTCFHGLVFIHFHPLISKAIVLTLHVHFLCRFIRAYSISLEWWSARLIIVLPLPVTRTRERIRRIANACFMAADPLIVVRGGTSPWLTARRIQPNPCRLPFARPSTTGAGRMRGNLAHIHTGRAGHHTMFYGIE